MTMQDAQQDLLRKIVHSPEDDRLRLDYSELIAKHDHSLSQFIQLQIARAARARRAKGSEAPTGTEKALHNRHGAHWASLISPLVVRTEFHRGFVGRVVIDPYVFLDRGEWILEQAPIRHVGFVLGAQAKFPLQEILKSPLLVKMDSIGFAGLDLSDIALEHIAASSNLSSCLWLGLKENSISLKGFRSLAASRNTKALLYIDRAHGTDPDYHPGQRLETSRVETEDPWQSSVPDWAPLGEDGKALEREFGYLPWLHPQDNACDKFDARWFVEQGILPKKPAGSPVD